jgi:predicted transcriptional regulator of viral defense system
VSVPFGFTPDTYPVDPFILAGKISSDAVLAYHTALQFFGKAHSVREEMIFLTGKAIRPMTFRGYEYRGVAFPQSLVDKKQELFAVNVVERTGIAIKLTSLERTLVDLLDRPIFGGGWEEIWRSLEAVEFFDVDKVIDYARLLGNATTVAKVGFYLEQHRKDLMVDDSHLERLREGVPKQPTYMSRNVRGRLVKKWNLLVSEQILYRSWEETY